MNELKEFSNYTIDWNLSPEHAVTMYLEWGNNNWHAEYPPVRSKSDYATYFVIDTWDDAPIIRLVRRNSENAENLISFLLPQELMDDFKHEFAELKGVFEPTPKIKDWLRQQLG